MIILPILTTNSHYVTNTFLFKRLWDVLFELGSERVHAHHWFHSGTANPETWSAFCKYSNFRNHGKADWSHSIPLTPTSFLGSQLLLRLAPHRPSSCKRQENRQPPRSTSPRWPRLTCRSNCSPWAHVARCKRFFNFYQYWTTLPILDRYEFLMNFSF